MMASPNACRMLLRPFVAIPRLGSRAITTAFLIACFVILPSSGRQASAIDYRIVLATGDLLPDTQEQRAKFIVNPSINATGRAAVVATFLNPSLSYGSFTDSVGPLIGAGVNGQPVPQLTGWTFDKSEVAAFNNAGVVVNFQIANNNRYLVSRGGAVPLEPIAFTGMTAPGLGTATFDRMGNYPGLNSAGAVAFSSTVVGAGPPANTQGVWTDAPGYLDLATATGFPAHGAPGANFVAFSDPMVSDQGDVTFLALLDVQLGNAPNSIGLWTRPVNGLPSAVVIPGDPVPQTSDFFDSTKRFAIDANGRAVFTTALVGPQVSSANNSGMWRQTSSGLRKIAREGDPAPGAGGALFAEFLALDSVSPAGDVGFGVDLVGPGVNAANDYALFADHGGALTMVFREGDPAPGVPGAIFDRWGTLFAAPQPEINDAGDIAFGATISGPGVTAANNAGIWLTHPAGDRLVVRTGQPIDLDPSPQTANIKIVSGLQFANTIGTSGRFDRRVFNNAYQVGFVARFTDGTEAAIVADVFTGLPAILVGDANLDAAVNTLDLETLAANWRRRDDVVFQQGDFDGNGVISASDLELLRLNWDAGPEDFEAALAAIGPLVPEPPSWLLAGVGGLLMVMYHPRRPV